MWFVEDKGVTGVENFVAKCCVGLTLEKNRKATGAVHDNTYSSRSVSILDCMGFGE